MRHKTNSIYNEDCHEGLKELPDNSIDLVLCDPPYNTTDNEWDQQPLKWDDIWTELKRIGKENAAYVFTASQPFTTDLILSNREWHRYNLVWDKVNGGNPLLSNKMPMKRHEDIVVFYEKQPTYNKQRTELRKYPKWSGQNNISYYAGTANKWQNKDNYKRYKDPHSILKYKNPRGGDAYGYYKHPTQKPVELMEWLIKTYTNEDEVVLDFCIGSGTTGVAAIQTGRKYIGYETDDEYYQTAVERCNKAERKRTKQEQFFQL